MLDIAQVTQDILHWSETFVEVPHPALGNWAPCPFARKARLAGTVKIIVGSDPYFDLFTRCKDGLGTAEVVIYAYDPAEWDFATFHSSLDQANREFLLANDLLVLEDHPADPEIVNGISMNQGTYALAMLQSLSKLNTAATQMHHKGFYESWPADYLEQLFQPRAYQRNA
jgi:hypothetical protein